MQVNWKMLDNLNAPATYSFRKVVVEVILMLLYFFILLTDRSVNCHFSLTVPPLRSLAEVSFDHLPLS